MKKLVSPQSNWKNSAIEFSLVLTKHFGSRKVGYENSATDKGQVIQLGLYRAIPLHNNSKRIIYVVTIDMVEQQYEQHNFKACVVVAHNNNQIQFVKWINHEQIPATCITASLLGEIGDLRQYVDRNNLLILPKHIVSVCLHHFDELWSHG